MQELRLFRNGANVGIKIYNSTIPEIGKVIEIQHTVVPTAPNTETIVRYILKSYYSLIRYHTDLNSNGRFWTDNGIEMRERRRIAERKVEANYYPMQSFASLRSDTEEFTVWQNFHLNNFIGIRETSAWCDEYF